MKLLLILILSNLSVSFAKEATFDGEKRIREINKLVDKNKIHQALLELKKDNLHYKKTLMKEKSYKPALFYFTINLELLLNKIPHNLDLISSCSQLKKDIIHGEKEKWEELDPPTHLIWKSFKKICL